jgi:hypothetical protein
VSHADRVIAKLPLDVQTVARTLFLQLVTAERTRAVRELDELEVGAEKAEIDRLVNHLVESRLLVVQTTAAGTGATVELIHESLIVAWPTLRRWLDESHEDTVFIEQLRAASRQWQAKKRESGLLWGGEMAEELLRFRRRFRGELSDVARAFSDAVSAQRARVARRKQVLLVGGTTFLLALLAVAAVALVVIRNAQMAAERNATAARTAEADAQRRLRDVEMKEQERQKEEARRHTAEEREKTATTNEEQTKEQLAATNFELTQTLVQVTQQRQRAQVALTKAEQDERAAREAEERARQAARQLEQAVQRERERADRLNRQLGSPIVEALQ